jgi:penicillin-binding protein 2
VSRYHSIYATQPKSPRPWPLVMMAFLVIVLSGATGALIARGDSPRSLLNISLGGPDNDPTVTEVALAAATGTATLPPAEINVPTEAAISTESLPTSAPATGGPGEGELALAAIVGTPGATVIAETVAVADASSPRDVVEAFGARWSASDYSGMYDLLSTPSKEIITRQEFVDRYDAIAAEAGLSSVTLTVTGDPSSDGLVPVAVAYRSNRVGDFDEQNGVKLRKEDGDWWVEWTPSLIFSALGDGCVHFSAESVRRGSILDRDGDPLAYDGAISVVGIVPGMLENETQTIAKLSKLIGMPVKEIKAKYEDAQPDWFMPVKTYPAEVDATLLTGIGELPGVALRAEIARLYPLGAKAAHITGYVTKVSAEDLANDTTGALVADQWIGRAGLEAGANDLLAGVPGGALTVVDCDSRQDRETISARQAVPPQDLTLTIDKDFQISVDDALGDVTGSAVIIDPRNGAILALASHPSYDPNWFVLGFTDKDWAYVNDETKRPLLNRAAEAGYPTGSIFKVITMAAGMVNLGFDGNTEIDCPQQWSIPGSDQIWRDWTYEAGMGAQGVLSLHWALVNSCNTVFYQIGNWLDEQDDALLPDMAKTFGLGAPTGIAYLAEIAGTVPDPDWKMESYGDYWARGDAVNLSIGQGYLEATPLQMANAYTAIANGGKLLKPFIVEFTQEDGGPMRRVGKRKVLRTLPLDEAQIAEIQSAMRDQTSSPYGHGSMQVFGDFGWPIAGKTGTAQNQMTVEQKPHSWFAGWGPFGEEATIASIVMVETSGEGVSFAAPRTRTMYEAYLQTGLANPLE